MATLNRIVPCLWFDDQAEAAAELYTSIFDDSKIVSTLHYSEVGKEFHGKEPGTVMTVAFELNGHPFTALNGGPVFKFNEAISFEIHCQSQEEVDYYWQRLSEGGDRGAQQCGWLKDRFGVSWQVVPTALHEMLSDSDPEKVRRVSEVMLQMKKLDVAALERAYEG
jgi:predicted 3-demethylubiquinone-9 3-methyltransferase (glyoxalase superfamily)